MSSADFESDFMADQKSKSRPYYSFTTSAKVITVVEADPASELFPCANNFHGLTE